MATSLELAGCYVVSTDVLPESMSTQEVHDSYVSLQRVERDFRAMKTGLLEVRPVFVRKESRTRGHVFCCMLALKLSREMERRLREHFGTTDSNPQIDRIDKRLVFKWLNNRPYFHGETEPCINGRILGLGSYFKEPNDALANQLLGEQLEDGGWNCEAWPFLSPKRPPSRRSSRSTPPSACSKDCSITNEQGANQRLSRRLASAPKIISSNAACSARFAPAKSSTSAGYDSRSRRFGITTSCADSSTCGMQESSPTVASGKPSKS
jgi:hypothetical protein